MRDIAKRILESEEEVLRFEKWAFGDDNYNPQLANVPKIWNNLHGDKLRLHGYGKIEFHVAKMIEVWENECKHISA